MEDDSGGVPAVGSVRECRVAADLGGGENGQGVSSDSPSMAQMCSTSNRRKSATTQLAHHMLDVSGPIQAMALPVKENQPEPGGERADHDE
ncbi:hypothetical protein GCM10009582_08420 [Arthrobacter flavus]